MITISFKALENSTASAREQKPAEIRNRMAKIAPAIIDALKSIEELTDDERNALAFVGDLFPSLDRKVAGCGDMDTARANYQEVCEVGPRRYFANNTQPGDLFDLLSNLGSTFKLYKAVKIVQKESDKAAKNCTLDNYIASNCKLQALAALPGARDVLKAAWFEYLRGLNISEGAIRDLCKASDVDYEMAEGAEKAAKGEANDIEAQKPEANDIEAQKPDLFK